MECPIQVSIDNHTMLVIASDGNPVQPIEGKFENKERRVFVLQFY